MRAGFLVKRPGNDQLTHSLVTAVNRALDSGELSDAVLFHAEAGLPCVRPRFGMMHWSEAYGDPSPMVATCLSSAMALKAMPSPAVKAFLAWELEWMEGPREYRQLLSLYGCPWLRLLARGESHAKAMRQAWNREAADVGDFDIAALKEALE